MAVKLKLGLFLVAKHLALSIPRVLLFPRCLDLTVLRLLQTNTGTNGRCLHLSVREMPTDRLPDGLYCVVWRYRATVRRQPITGNHRYCVWDNHNISADCQDPHNVVERYERPYLLRTRRPTPRLMLVRICLCRRCPRRRCTRFLRFRSMLWVIVPMGLLSVLVLWALRPVCRRVRRCSVVPW